MSVVISWNQLVVWVVRVFIFLFAVIKFNLALVTAKVPFHSAWNLGCLVLFQRLLELELDLLIVRYELLLMRQNHPFFSLLNKSFRVDGGACFLLFVEPACLAGLDPIDKELLRFGVRFDQNVVFVKL